MEAKELRIGNLVHYEYKEMSKDIEVDITVLQELEHFIYRNRIKPILLTEEWLLKFGFDGDQQEGWESTCGKDVYLQDWGDDNYRHVSNRGCCVMQIKYVHSLQNLYFALTGEELTINK